MSRPHGSSPNFQLIGFFALSAWLMPIGEAAAQHADTVRAGQKPLPFAIRTGLVEDEMFMVNNGATSPGPKSTKDTREVACGNARCYLVVMASATPRGPMTDSVWIDHKSLALVRHVEVGFGNRTEVNVANGRIKGAAVDSSKSVRNIDAEAPAFDFSVLEEILTGLPLKAGFNATVHTFDVTQGFRDVGVSVTGEERLETPKGKRDAWVVELSFSTHKATRWIDKETRAGLKWQVDMGNGRRIWGQTVSR